DQNLMDRAARPRPAKIGCKTARIEAGRDRAFAAALMDKGAVNFAHQRDLVLRSRCQDHPVGLDALVLTARKNPLGRAVFVDQHAPQAEPGRAALAKTLLD